MTLQHQAKTRKGSILVVTLILLLVMTTMGVGLLYSTKKSAQQVGRSVDKTASLYSAESCIVDAVKWLENAAKSGVPCKNGGCFNSRQKNMSRWELSNEWSGDKKAQAHKNKAKNQKYECRIYLVGEVMHGDDEGIGFDIGESETYNNVSTNAKYMYRINSKSFVGNLTSEVEEFVSITF